MQPEEILSMSNTLLHVYIIMGLLICGMMYGKMKTTGLDENDKELMGQMKYIFCIMPIVMLIVSIREVFSMIYYLLKGEFPVLVEDDENDED